MEEEELQNILSSLPSKPKCFLDLLFSNEELYKIFCDVGTFNINMTYRQINEDIKRFKKLKPYQRKEELGLFMRKLIDIFKMNKKNKDVFKMIGVELISCCLKNPLKFDELRRMNSTNPINVSIYLSITMEENEFVGYLPIVPKLNYITLDNLKKKKDDDGLERIFFNLKKNNKIIFNISNQSFQDFYFVVFYRDSFGYKTLIPSNSEDVTDVEDFIYLEIESEWKYELDLEASELYEKLKKNNDMEYKVDFFIVGTTLKDYKRFILFLIETKKKMNMKEKMKSNFGNEFFKFVPYYFNFFYK